MSESLQIFPALDAAIEAALEASIRRFGVVVPIVVDQDGRILDGHHRKAIAARLGIDCPESSWATTDEDEARELVISLNADRGHRMRSDVRREIVAELREDGHSLRAIAGAVGVSVGTVHADLSTVQDRTVPDRVVGLDGKSRPARRQSPAPVAPPVERLEPARPAPKPGPPRNGLHFARIALLNLEQIRRDDLERADALTLIRRWIHDNEQ